MFTSQNVRETKLISEAEGGGGGGDQENVVLQKLSFVVVF